VVPQLALQEQQGAKVALVVEAGDKVAFRQVAVEEAVGDVYIVKSGLKAGERVIVDGVQKVRPGMQVKAVTKSLDAPAAAPAPAPAPKPAAKPGA
jgi:membrane fusion protein (multidrug efflux system)